MVLVAVRFPLVHKANAGHATALASGMATVTLRLRGGPCDGETSTMDVIDPNEPPEVFTVQVHGPHEAMERFEYRRSQRGLEGGPDAGVWIYQACMPM
jgi:hypothetical protein